MDTAEYETNAIVINNISSISYVFYEPVSQSTHFSDPGTIELEATLRKDGYLAHADNGRRGLWCFRVWKKDEAQPGPNEPPTFSRNIDLCGYNLAISEEGLFEPASLNKNRGYTTNPATTPATPSIVPNAVPSQSGSAPSSQSTDQDKSVVLLDAKVNVPLSGKESYDHFIAALVSTLAIGFCKKTGAIPLNSRTFLLPREERGEAGSKSPVLASLKAYLTTTGALVTILSLSIVNGLVPLAANANLPPLGITVLAAPFGLFATCQPSLDGEFSSVDGATARSPDTQVTRLRADKDERPRHWKSIFSRLQARSITLPTSGKYRWLSLQRVRRGPAELKYDGKRTPMVQANPSMSWPSSLCFCKAFSNMSIQGTSEEDSAPADKSYDPLSEAQGWFLGSTKRDELLAKKKQERDAAAQREANQVDGQQQANSGLSPLALHRPNNAGPPLGAMYPTPPDGVHTQIGVTPSGDGTAPSPGNLNLANPIVDMDHNTTIPPDAFPESWDNATSKRERANGSFDSENLFGDLGPDMFGDNDITDADFNFFDNEQSGAMDLSLDLPDMATTNQDSVDAADITMTEQNETRNDTPAAPSQTASQDHVFAKPELRHARSSLLDEPRKNSELEASRTSIAGVKRQASPFNPDTVFKRIRASLNSRKTSQQDSVAAPQSLGSIFDKVDFGPGLSLVNSKYQGNGRFDFTFSMPHGSKPTKPNHGPRASFTLFRGSSQGRSDLKESTSNVGSFLARVASGQGSFSQQTSPNKMDDLPSDADDVSLISDQDDSSVGSDEPASPFKPPGIRRPNIDDDGASLATSFRELEFDAASPHLSVDLPRSTKSDIELPLVKYFADPEPIASHLSLPDVDFVLTAQILMEQVSSSSLALIRDSSHNLAGTLDQRRELLNITRQSIQELRQLMPTFLGAAVECSLKPFTEVQDVPLIGQPTRMQPRPPGAEPLKPNNLFQITAPHFEVRRYESKLSVLPSAIAFWESLGLGPSNGTKDIESICIFPGLPGLTDDASEFLERMQSVYESLKLGSFTRLAASADVPGGLLSYETDGADETFLGTSSILSSSLLSGLTKLSEVLLHVATEKKNFVVYFVYAQDNPSAMVESCHAFHQLFERYRKMMAANRRQVSNELVLQLIPIDFIASASTIALPTPLEFGKLALETYDRCTLFGGAMPSPAVVLEQPLPRVIDFKLTTAPSSSLLHENSCMHIAYAQSIDERWISAAWTDNRGLQQATASYCLGRRDKGLSTPFADVAREMWDSTRELISIWKVHWRIIITKCGVMEQSEIEQWSALAQVEAKASVSLTLLTVDTNPSLQLLPPAVKIPNTAQSAFYTTPVSTPQASIVSPEAMGNPPTPSIRDATAASAPTASGGAAATNVTTDGAQADSEADATLVDVTDQTWGAVLSHRLNNSTSLAELNPSIVSGYLVKRSGPRPEDPPIVMEVNIVGSEGTNPRVYESVLREMLNYFRALGTLARARGTVEREADVRPWHVAAAEKGVRALYLLM